jgi:hypothetical protein
VSSRSGEPSRTSGTCPVQQGVNPPTSTHPFAQFAYSGSRLSGRQPMPPAAPLAASTYRRTRNSGLARSNPATALALWANIMKKRNFKTRASGFNPKPMLETGMFILSERLSGALAATSYSRADAGHHPDTNRKRRRTRSDVGTNPLARGISIGQSSLSLQLPRQSRFMRSYSCRVASPWHATCMVSSY